MRARKFWYHIHYHFTFKNGNTGTGTSTFYVKSTRIMTEVTLKKIRESIMESIEIDIGRKVNSLTISSYTFIRESRG